MQVIHRDTSNPTLPDNLASNTIYVLAPGTYIARKNQGTIEMYDCSAIIGATTVPTDTVIIKTQVGVKNSLQIAGSNIIVDNIHLDGQYTPDKKTHDKNGV